MIRWDANIVHLDLLDPVWKTCFNRLLFTLYYSHLLWWHQVKDGEEMYLLFSTLKLERSNIHSVTITGLHSLPTPQTVPNSLQSSPICQPLPPHQDNSTQLPLITNQPGIYTLLTWCQIVHCCPAGVSSGIWSAFPLLMMPVPGRPASQSSKKQTMSFISPFLVPVHLSSGLVGVWWLPTSAPRTQLYHHLLCGSLPCQDSGCVYGPACRPANTLAPRLPVWFPKHALSNQL